MTYQRKVYKKQGGDELVVASGGVVTVQSGGKITVESGGEIELQAGALFDEIAGLASVTFTIGSETGGNTINVGVQLKDANGNDLAIRANLLMYLSDDANGDAIAASAPSGGWAIGTDGLLIPQVTNKAAWFTSEADGDIDVNIVEAGAATWYVIAVLPNGKLSASAAITFAA